MYPIWLNRLVFPFRYGKLAAGTLIFIVMWVLLILCSRGGEIGFFAELFFAAMCAYLVPVFSLILARSVATFDGIEGTLDASAEERARWRKELTHRSLRWFAAISTFALIMGVANHHTGASAAGAGIGRRYFFGQRQVYDVSGYPADLANDDNRDRCADR